MEGNSRKKCFPLDFDSSDSISVMTIHSVVVKTPEIGASGELNIRKDLCNI